LKENNKLQDDKLIICRCEEITKGEVVEAVCEGYTTVNDIRKRTRAGMGFCQGKTCEKLVQQTIGQYTGKEAANIFPARVRPPVRPVSAQVFAKGSDEINP